MSDPQVIDLPLPDQSARDRIAGDLDTNILVEAGAGSGKTTALIARMVALVERGEKADSIAAVTFTRKAAGELRERFQIRVEERIAAARTDTSADPGVVENLMVALQDIDRMFIGTIHAFCARLLRERPLEVGLDPGFKELPVEERNPLQDRFWASYLARLTRDSDPILEDLARAGLRTNELGSLFAKMVENSDVDFPAPETAPPSRGEVRAVLERLSELVDFGMELMPPKPDKGWDKVQQRIRRLHFLREVTGWEERVHVFEALEVIRAPKNGHKVTQNRWRSRETALQVQEALNEFNFGAETEAARLLGRWYSHRYAVVLRLVRGAVEEYRAHRIRIGKLDFPDLLQLAAELLRSDAGVRRQLGERYRRVLVDEFQDTDPLQAEIMLLLTSDPEAEDESDGGPADWRTTRPRPGGLFVVGDPKQSIYRFRRADIQLYQWVKLRFEQFGSVLRLTSNFRSRPPIGDLVNDLFDSEEFFPEEATPEQAAFEPLDTRPGTSMAPAEGVFYYRVNPSGSKKSILDEDDAERLAGWIASRIESGERTASDFLVLTRVKGPLSAHARALEARGIPIQVTGGGIGVEEELTELLALLECLIDPTNKMRVVSALVGFFFGIDYERLVEHKLRGGGFDLLRPLGEGHPDVIEAMRRLRGWWRMASAEPADVVVTTLAAELGLLPFAAAGELGSLRAGALGFAMDSVREAALAGHASLPGALDALRAALAHPDAEAPLEPGRPDAVRLMNLHQAKGLEAPVVVLADPAKVRPRPIWLHVHREDEGHAVGFLKVLGERYGPPLAEPQGWDEYSAAERAFEDAEKTRLLYVAVTRAMEELVVSRWEDSEESSVWAPLHGWLDERAGALELDRVAPDPREALESKPSEMVDRTAAAGEAIGEAAIPTYRHLTVTHLAKEVGIDEAPTEEGGEGTPTGPYRGMSWGSVVHGALAAAAEAGTEESLRATCRDLLVEEGRPLDDHGEPIELDELTDLVARVRESDLWSRAAEAERLLVEVPFAAPMTPPEQEPPSPSDVAEEVEAPEPGNQLDLFGTAAAPDEEAEEIEEAQVVPEGAMVVEGVIDLAFLESDGWVIADYKTDVGTDPDFPERAIGYRKQVELYAEAWAGLTRRKVKERVLFYTAQDRIESW